MKEFKKICWQLCGALVYILNILRVIVAGILVISGIVKTIELLVNGFGEGGFASVKISLYFTIAALFIGGLILFFLGNIFDNLKEKIKDKILFNTTKHYSYETIAEFEKAYINKDLSLYSETDIHFLSKELETKWDLQKMRYPQNNANILNSAETQNNEKVASDYEEVISQREINSYTKKGSKNPKADLEKLIGLVPVKKQIEDMRIRFEYDKLRGTNGKVLAARHMCFYGPPGTGKTTVARIMSGILYELNIIRKNQVVEVSGTDLTGHYYGFTAKRTKKILEAAKGGVLFIDEAYSLSDMGSALGGASYGEEAIAELIKFMEDNKEDIVIIFAGYPNKMEEFIKVNEGMRSRIGYYVSFPNYTPEEMSEIFVSMAKEQNYTVTRELALEIAKYSKYRMEQSVKNEDGSFANARTAGQFLDRVITHHAKRIMKSEADKSSIDILTIDDFPWFENEIEHPLSSNHENPLEKSDNVI